MLVLTSGRPGIGLWLSRNADGQEWEYYNVVAQHNARVPPELRFPPAFSNVTNNTNRSSCETGHCDTTSYTGLTEVEPGVLLLAYDRRHQGALAHRDDVFSMRIQVPPARGIDDHVDDVVSTKVY